MLGLCLMLLALHKQFTVGIEQDKIELLTLNTIFKVVIEGLIISSTYSCAFMLSYNIPTLGPTTGPQQWKSFHLDKNFNI